MTVRQLDNVLDLLEFFAEQGRPASLAEVSRHFDWPRSSTFNILTTLSQRGFLFEPEGRGRFYPSPRWLSLAERIAAAGPLPEALARVANDLAARTGETVFIAGASGRSVVFLLVIQSKERVRYAAEAGQRLPLHATASGQAIMSQWSEAQRTAVLRKVVFERYGAGTPLGIDAVEDQMRAGLNRGWFRSASNYSVDLGGVAVPLTVDGKVYSLTVAGPINRIDSQMFSIARTMHDSIAREFGLEFLKDAARGLTVPPVDLD